MSRISHDVGMNTGAAQASGFMRVTDDFWQHVGLLLPVRKRVIRVCGSALTRIAANLFMINSVGRSERGDLTGF